MSSLAAAQHPCQAISAPDTHYHFLGGLYPDVKMFGDTNKTAVKGSGPEYPRQHRLPSPWLMGQELPGYKEPRKIYCPLPIEFVLSESQAAVGRLLTREPFHLMHEESPSPSLQRQ